MAEGSAQSRYVRLTKDQGPLEDITPGELNQPIQVPQVFFFSLSVSFLFDYEICVVNFRIRVD